MNTVKPTAPTTEDQTRWMECDKRLPWWEGTWYTQLSDNYIKAMGMTRRSLAGILDQSCNLPKQICLQRAVLYQEPPQVFVDGKSAEICAVEGPVTAAMLWPSMADFQGRVLLVNEYLVLVKGDLNGRLAYTFIEPSRIVAEADPMQPDQPNYLKVLQPDGDWWVWEEWDIRDVENPVYSVTRPGQSGKPDVDVTADWLVGEDPYPWKIDDKPFIPGVLYHKEPSKRLWNPSRGIELMAGGKMASVLWSWWTHLMRRSCFKQPVLKDGEIVSGIVQSDDRTKGRMVVSDPTAWLFVKTRKDSAHQVGLDMIDETADVEKIAGAIDLYCTRVAEGENLPPNSLQRVGAQARSGYAIALTNSGKRQEQRRFAQFFRAYDSLLMQVSAAVANIFGGASYPTGPYSIVYPPIPMSPEEQKELREQIDWELENGFCTPVEALMRLRPGLAESEAKQMVARVANPKKKPKPEPDLEDPEDVEDPEEQQV